MRAAARLLIVLALAVAPLSPAPAAVAAIGGPLVDQDFPDPDVVRVGDAWYAYATNEDEVNIQVARSTDLRTWEVLPVDALPDLGPWADPDWYFRPGDRGVWAPDVSVRDDGTLVLYYTAHNRDPQAQCIGVATSSSPTGPFTPVGAAPLVCPVADGGAIDPASYAEDGRRYLLWKNDGNCCGRDTWLHLQPTSADGLTLTGPATRLIRQDRAFEGALVEAPTLWRHDGRYVLFYSANSFADDRYLTSYATSASLTGPYDKAPNPLLTTATTDGSVRGPGGQDVVTGPDGRDRIFFHGWDPGYAYRGWHSAELGWADGLPVVRGSRVRYEAERGELTGLARTRGAPGASDGRVVGYIDDAGSSVTVRVFAARAGGHTLAVRFANGSGTGASHTLAVNGVGAGTVDYPDTGWDAWSEVRRGVTLAEGWNTLRFGKGAWWAELDAVDVS